MQRAPVQSSNVRSVGYDAGVLEVEFSSGGVYRYAGVPEATYQALMKSPSIGRYVAAQVVGKFETEKL